MTDTTNIELSPEGIKRSQQPFRDALSSAKGGRPYAITHDDLAPIAYWIAYCETQDTSPSTSSVGKYLKERVAPYSPTMFPATRGQRTETARVAKDWRHGSGQSVYAR